jgi:outer membrane protein TolC
MSFSACRPAVVFLSRSLRASAAAASRAAVHASVPTPQPARASAPAQTHASVFVADLVAAAQRDNPTLQAARGAIEVSRARLANTGLKPNPRLELGARSDFPFGNEGEYELSVAVSQDIPMAGRLLRAKDVARVNVAEPGTAAAPAATHH